MKSTKKQLAALHELQTLDNIVSDLIRSISRRITAMVDDPKALRKLQRQMEKALKENKL